ncbi:MAG: hypothetical protein K0R08_678 [Solimicrobium sp.]|jgi:hypothetical protein|nr:hypothetical protein [Solimicrobium sp.]
MDATCLESENPVSFKDYLITHDDTQSCLPTYQYFKRTASQEEIGQLEQIDPQLPYLASILDLTSEHIPFLKILQETAYSHLENVLGVKLKEDFLQMFFHFPYPEVTTTLHLHIQANRVNHPMDGKRSFSLKEIIDWLESGKEISDLVLARKPYYFHSSYPKILDEIDGINMETVKNPCIVTSPHVEVHFKNGEEPVLNFMYKDKT